MTAALIVLGIVAYAVVAGVAWALYEQHLGDAGDLTWFMVGVAWPVYLALGVCALPVLLGRWLARPRPKPDPDAELRELDERFAAELGIETERRGR